MMLAMKTRNEARQANPISTIQRDAPLTDAVLVRRARENDRFAQNAIYRRYAGYLLGLATRLTGRTNDADDLVQETFFTAFRKLGQLNDPDALYSWLIRILMSQVKRSFRLRKLKSFFGLDTGRDDASLHSLAAHNAHPDVRAELRLIDNVLNTMAPHLRAAWMLRRVEGMTISETALAVNRSMATVKRYVAEVDEAVGVTHGGGR
jgi:RNA polymerase sigma-70 factor (ECF subfamily)